MVFYFYNTKFFFLPVSSYVWSQIILVIIFIFVTTKKNAARKSYADVDFYMKTFFFWFLLLLSAIASLMKNYNNYDIFFLRMLFACFISSILFPYVYIYFFRFKPAEGFKYIGMVGFVNSIFIIFMFISPHFQSFWLSKIVEAVTVWSNVDIYGFIGLRMIGINGFSSYSTAVIQIILSIFYILHIFLSEGTFSKKSFFVLFAMLLSAVLSARTTFVILPIFLVYYIYLFDLKYVGLLSVGIFFIATLFSQLLNLIRDKTTIYYFTDWIFEIYRNLLETGSLLKNIDMLNKYSFYQYSMLGDFRMVSETGYYMQTDVGYQRFLFAIGYIGMFFFVLFIKTSFFLPKTNEGKIFFYAYISILLIISIAMFKGAILYDSFPLISTLFILGFYIRQENIKSNY